MIRIAIPIFHHRVSPVLDTCTRLLVIDYEEETEVGRREILFDGCTLSERFERIRKLSPTAVICCGISEEFDRLLQTTGIRLICGIVGDVQQVAEAFSDNRLDAPCFKMPGSKPL
jgi:predicted Fe-Mo cluster-binding NifX family protein